MKNFLNVIACYFVMSLSLFGQKDSLSKNDWKFKIDSTYTKLIKDNKIVGASIAIVHNGEIVYANGFGFQNKSRQIEADSNTIYRIGSISKSFTDVAIMQLNEKGLLRVNDPLQKYLPQLKMKSRFSEENPIIIGDVMSHTAGLPSDFLNGFFCDNPPTIDWVIDQLNYCTMSAPPKFQHSYSNVGYGVLGRLIEVVSGQTYNDYLHQNVFGPLKMESSAVILDKIHEGHVSKGYLNGKEIDETLIRDVAAGLISSTVMDMSNYIKMYLALGKTENGQFLSENSIAEMKKNRTGDITLPTTAEWGYGLYSNAISIISDKDTMHTKIVGHGGDTGAFHADLQFIPELNIGAVVLTNTDNGVRIASAKSLIRQYLKELEGKKLVASLDSLNRKTYTDSPCTAEEIKGTYFYSGIKIEVDKTEKLKLKQGANTIIFKEQNDSLYYTAKIRLLNIIPIKVKNQAFKFVKHNNEIYLKGLNTKSKSQEYIAKKSIILPVSTSWKNALGKYEAVGTTFQCKECPFMNFETLSFTLKEKKGMLVASVMGKSKDTKQDITFEIVSDNVCVTPGIGRNTGATLRILENGNLFFEGFELKLKD
jgi:CubicO group peptidase (beta-lactamase class C family)